MEITLKPVESLIFRSDVVALGAFRCSSDHPLFRDSGPCTYHTIAFPRTSTFIRHEEGASFVGSPNTASLYNQHQRYTRAKIDNSDTTDWMVLSDDLLFEVIGAFDRGVERRPDRPFRHASAPVDAQTYLAQRRLVENAKSMDALAVEEAAVRIASRVLASAYRARLSPVQDRDRAEAVKTLIAAHPARNSSLRDLAAAVETSPFHLCRTFRSAAGVSMTTYRHSLRLRRALALLRTAAEITEIALELGYSSHSHFTAVFRRHFGITPSQFRDSRGSVGSVACRHVDESSAHGAASHAGGA